LTGLQPYSLSACRLKVTSSNETTNLSGVWIKGASRDVILTVSHFKKDPKISTSTENTTAEVFTSIVGNTLPGALGLKCKLVYDFNDPIGERDFAIFTPNSHENVRSPTQSVAMGSIFIEATLRSGLAISFGYNSTPTEPREHHPDPDEVQRCPCTYCWYASGLAVSTKLNVDLALREQHLDPLSLGGGHRSIGVGEWKLGQNGKNYHTIPGWYGISGAGMYAYDLSGQLRLVALCRFFNVSLLYRTNNFISSVRDVHRPRF
jgi:hypothetical protein